MCNPKAFLSSWTLILGFCIGLAGCGRARSEAPGKLTPTVAVSHPLQREVTDYQDYTGRTAAVDSVQVQARVTGYLDKIHFKEGAEVAEGTVLYEIDPRQYQDTYDSAKAQVAANVASLILARQNNARFKKLGKDQLGAVTPLELDRYQSQEDQSVANLDQSRANLATAKLNLDWTRVTAPVTGLIGRLLVTRGNLITANQTTLATIVRQDPMWVYFDMDEPTALQLKELDRQGKFGPSREGRPPRIPFRLQLANEQGFPHEAILDFVNNQLDQATATLLIRALFPNPLPDNGPRVFAPNNFVRVRVATSPPYQALLVSPEAVGTDQDLKYLYAVDENSKVVRRAVKLGSLQDGLQVVAEGIKPGERVIVSGLQRVQPGATVSPKLVPMPIPAEGSVAPVVLQTPAPSPKK
ncbi:MAG TPA: efflux RND transporter periplasmic adaptor subunit [Pirellulales bacterium]|jgi:RND family efflux transporter MFP subunit|nr:efflux RND transporter periplasmic adaptor subunit [Pirellulales bacterium]